MLAQLSTAECHDRRGHPRHFVDLPPILIETEMVTEKVRLINIARHGLLAHSRLQYDTGAAVLVHFRGLPCVRARVAWWKRGMVGVTFAEGLDDEMLAALGVPPAYPDLISDTAESRSNR